MQNHERQLAKNRSNLRAISLAQEVLETRDKATVLAYLRRAKESGLLAAVTEVTTDMWDAYVEAAREAFGPSVAVTIDRFHVMKNLQEQLTAARRQIQRATPAESNSTATRIAIETSSNG